MSPKKYDFGFEVRPALSLSYIEEVLKHARVITPVPSRPSLIALIDEGILEGIKTKQGWVVYEDSFHEWVKSFQRDAYKKIGGNKDGGRLGMR
ncbi:MAG TPA: hypothetical protein VFA21_20450 [Pyrinomonadaceae bacterium]|nr:hypothetical protein [Pyrinomonadaceae bacterium]